MATNTEPSWYQNMLAANAINLAKVATPVTTPNTITCMAGGAEMLKVGPDGFWVRGVKVEQDEKEAQKVYEGFKAWMMWAQLNKEYR